MGTEGKPPDSLVNKPIPTEVNEIHSEMLMAERDLVLNPYKEQHPEDAEKMQRAFDEYVKVENELFIRLGGKILFKDVENIIPNNKFVVLMKEVGRTMESGAGFTSQIISQIRLFVAKMLRRFKND